MLEVDDIIRVLTYPKSCSEMKGLSIQFRLAYNNYRTDYNFEAYRDLHGYDFETATKDFYDVRLYLDYMF